MVGGKETRKASQWLNWERSKEVEGKGKGKRREWRDQRVQGQAKERKRSRNQDLELTYRRQTPSRRGKRGESGRKELVVQRTRKPEGVDREERRKLQEKVETFVGGRVKAWSGEVSREKEGPKDQGPKEWKESVRRVGTGFRVRKDEKNPQRRRFDVGYSDRKTYTRKPGREAVVDQSSMGRTLIGKGENARVKVMNAVCDREKRRRVSEYTGSGIRRKSRVGKRKLKPTKPQAKQ